MVIDIAIIGMFNCTTYHPSFPELRLDGLQGDHYYFATVRNRSASIMNQSPALATARLTLRCPKTERSLAQNTLVQVTQDDEIRKLYLSELRHTDSGRIDPSAWVFVCRSLSVADFSKGGPTGRFDGLVISSGFSLSLLVSTVLFTSVLPSEFISPTTTAAKTSSFRCSTEG